MPDSFCPSPDEVSDIQENLQYLPASVRLFFETPLVGKDTDLGLASIGQKLRSLNTALHSIKDSEKFVQYSADYVDHNMNQLRALFLTQIMRIYKGQQFYMMNSSAFLKEANKPALAAFITPISDADTPGPPYNAARCISPAMEKLGETPARYPYMELSLMLALSFFHGITDSFLGPSLQDLQCIYSVSVQTISILIPLYGGFKTAGCAMHAPLHVKVNAFTLMIVCVLISSCLVLAIPLCSSFWVAATTSSGLGLAEGVLTTATTAKIGELSQDSAIPFHMMALALCTGNVLGALVISPFLSNTIRPDNTSNLPDLEVMTIECENSESNIVYAYLIFASFGTIVAIFLTILRVCRDNNTEHDSHTKKMKDNFGKVELIFIIFFASLIFLTAPTHVVYGSLLLLFGTHSSLEISEKTMALMTSSFYAVTVFGRLGGVLVSLVISQLWLVSVCLIGVLATSIFLICTAETSLVFLWAGSNVLGLFYAPLFASLVAWSAENVTVNNIVYTIIMFLDYAGLSLTSLSTGQLMSAFGPQMLHYSIAVLSGIQIMLFLCLFCLGKMIRKQKNEEYKALPGT
ncbi:major facilitator superfamily domain-containing protein 4A-like [Haliotis cracherodii]|uniref:major facilitator superfamily domain-containing protein 4A-like n=1 Tax=Haliotis cracherodii TaxID=6455 RepID=UPI0039EA9A71